MLKKLELKDYVLMGLLSAIYIVVTMVIMMVFSMLGPLVGHSLVYLVGGSICGIIIVFMCLKIGKTGIYTILYLLYILVSSLAGGFYLPWFISLMGSAILADIVSTKMGYEKLSSQLISYSLVTVGNVFGMVIPIWFFLDSYVERFTREGMMTPEQIASNLATYAGIGGLIMLVVAIIGACIGIFIGRKILLKHFSKSA